MMLFPLTKTHSSSRNNLVGKIPHNWFPRTNTWYQSGIYMISLAYYFSRLCSWRDIAVLELVGSNAQGIVWCTVGQSVPLPECYSLNLAQWVTNWTVLAWPAEVPMSANPHRAAFLEPESRRKDSQVSLGQNHQRTLGIMETGHFGTVNMPKPKMPCEGSWQILFLKPETPLFLT